MTDTRVEQPIAAHPKRREPKFYGWRYNEKRLPNGEMTTEMVPLRFKDLMYPQEGDQVAESIRHHEVWGKLANLIWDRLSKDPTRYAIFNCLIDWNVPGVQPLAPDVAIIRGVKPPTKDTATIRLRDLPGEVELIIEITSPNTRRLDYKDRLEKYHAARISRVVVVDLVRAKRRPEFLIIDRQWTPDGYHQTNVGQTRKVWLDALKLWLGVENSDIVFRDEENAVLLTYSELNQALADAKAKAEAEAQAAVARLAATQAEAQVTVARLADADDRIRRLREQLRQAGLEPSADDD